MNKIENENVLNEIFEEDKSNNSSIDIKVEDDLESKKANIVWVVNKDILEEIKSGIENNIFTQLSVKITPAMYLAKIGKTKDLYDLIKKEPELVNVSTCNGRTALMFAAQFGNINCLKLLLVAGAHIDAQDEHGATALMLASFFGQDESVRILLEHGANKMIKDCNNVNAKSLSKKCNDKLIFNLLDGDNDYYDNENLKVETLESNSEIMFI